MIYYIVFALATAIHAMFSLVYPVIALGRREGHDTKNSVATYIIFFIMIALVAPLIFLSCIVPSMADRFRTSLYLGIFEKD